MVETPRSVFRRYEVDGVPSSGNHKVDKDEVARLLERIQDNAGAIVSRATLDALALVEPGVDEFPRGEVLNDADPDNNGWYTWTGSEWERERGFPDTLARLVITGGTPNAIIAMTDAGLSPADVSAYLIDVQTPNTAEVTISINGAAPVPVRNVSGEDYGAGEFTGRIFLTPEGGYLRAITADASTIAALVAEATSVAPSTWQDLRDETIDARDKSQEWAELPEDAEVEPGQYSALHHSAKASEQRVLAETARTGAETAKDATLLAAASVGYFADTAAGILGTSPGDVFWTIEGDEMVYYENDSGSAVAIPKARFATGDVKLDKEGFVEFSTNLFNPATATEGFVVSSDGNITENASYAYSDFIEVEPGVDYSFLGIVSIARYDANKNFINRGSLETTGETQSTPLNVRFVRLNYQPEAGVYRYSRRMNKASELLPYEPYYIALDGAVTGPSMLGPQRVQNFHLEDDSVTVETAAFIEVNDNLFDHRDYTSGYRISDDGTIEEVTSYRISARVPALPSTQYTHGGTGSSGVGDLIVHVAFFDKDDNFISRSNIQDVATFETPERTAWMRFNFQGNPLSLERMVNIGDTLLPFEFRRTELSASISLGAAADELINPADRPRIDIPISGVFSTTRTYPEWSSGLRNPDNSRYTAAQVYELFDDLVAAHPDYITKQVLGDDLYDNEIAVYKFIPARPTATFEGHYPKVFLTCGIHGYEHANPLFTYLMMQDLCEHWDDDPLLEAMRFNVEFLIIPVVNPSGWDDYTRKNRNGVDLNRNFPEGWELNNDDPLNNTYRGPSPLSELEAQYVSQVFNENPDIDIMYDFHNFAGNEVDPPEHLLWLPVQSDYVQHLAQSFISRMTRKWRKDFVWIPSDLEWFAGYTETSGDGSVKSHAAGRGIRRTGTFEVGGRWWIEPGSINTLPYSEAHRRSGVDALINWVLMNLEDVLRS